MRRLGEVAPPEVPSVRPESRILQPFGQVNTSLRLLRALNPATWDEEKRMEPPMNTDEHPLLSKTPEFYT